MFWKYLFIQNNRIEKPRKNLPILVVFGLFLVCLSANIFSKYYASAATAPAIITYQGKLLVSTHLATTSQSMYFVLYDAASSGNVLYTASGTIGTPQPLSISPSLGLFSINLGGTGTNSLSEAIFQNNGSVYLEVRVGSDTLTPRKQISSVPYAFNSKYLDGVGVNTNSTTQYIPMSDTSGNFTFNSTTVSSTLTVRSATGVLATRGLLVARGHAVETLARIDAVVFDKTGTLTNGHPVLRTIYPQVGYGETEVLALAAAMEQASEHPLARALIDAAAKRCQAPLPRVADVKSVTGSGVVAEVDGVSLHLGRLDFVAALHGLPLPEEIEGLREDGLLLIALGSKQGWLGFFAMEDALRPSAKTTLSDLARLGIRSWIMSGDTQASAGKVGQMLGCNTAMGGLSPEGKHKALAELQQQGHVVAMVGDGINDAPVLAQAQVSVAMGEGTDLARAQGDMVLLGGSLAVLVDGIVIARRTMKIVRQNLAWAFAYNFFAIPFAMVGWVTPWMAGIGMSASSLLVVLNALRLQRN